MSSIPKKLKSYNLQPSSGFSSVEALLAASLFALLVTAFVGTYLYGQESTTLAGNRARAMMRAEEGLEAVRTIRDFAWNELLYDQSAIAVSSGTWSFVGEGSSEITGEFTRTLLFGDVCRDGSNQIVACPGSSTDAHTKRVTSTVTWQQNPQRTGESALTTYLQNWASQNWVQTDWAGGSGQSVWSDATKYETDDTDVKISAAGQLTLDTTPDNWALSAGSSAADTTDTDFNAGTYASTTVQGSGVDAGVVLTQTSSWIEHANSGVVGSNLFSGDIVSASDMWAVGAGGDILHYNGTAWSSFASLGTNINGIDMVSASDGWAVGNSGKFYRYNGTAWSEFVDLGASAVDDVVMVSSTDGWAVGDSSKFYRYNGTAWSEFVDLGASDVNALSMVSASDGWAVGDSGKFYRYNGTAWSEFTDIGGTALNDVVMVTASDGWVVGNNGEIYRWNGTAWSSVTSPVTTDINRVFMVSATDGWAVGASGKIVHWNGSSWSETIDIGATALNGVFFVNASNGWAIGNGGMIQQYANAYVSSGTFVSRVRDTGSSSTVWSAVSWTETLPTASDVTVATRTGNTATPDGTWSAFSAEVTDPLGSTITSPNARYIQYRITFTRGTSSLETPVVDDVTVVYNSPTSKSLNDVSAVAASNIWAVGNAGTILRYNGASWSVHADSGLVTQDVNGIDMVSASDGWAVAASEKFLRYNGTNWTEFADLGATSLNAVDMVSTSDGWAVGNSGKFYKYNGTTWSEFVDLGASNVFDLYMISSSSGWAVGAGGDIYRYNGTTWSSNATLGTTINGIDMVSASDGWAVGNSGKFYKYNGTTWSEFLDIGGTQLNAVDMISASEGWAAGDSGVLYKYNGTTWASVTSPNNKNLFAVVMLSSLDGWATGATGIILRYSKTGAYETQGLLTSSAFNAGASVKIQVVEWDQTVPSCAPVCQVRLQIRGAPDNAGLPGTWTSWYGETGADTYFTAAAGTLIPLALNGNRWIQYRAELIGDGSQTPTVTEIRVNYK